MDAYLASMNKIYLRLDTPIANGEIALQYCPAISMLDYSKATECSAARDKKLKEHNLQAQKFLRKISAFLRDNPPAYTRCSVAIAIAGTEALLRDLNGGENK